MLSKKFRHRKQTFQKKTAKKAIFRHFWKILTQKCVMIVMLSLRFLNLQMPSQLIRVGRGEKERKRESRRETTVTRAINSSRDMRHSK